MDEVDKSKTRVWRGIPSIRVLPSVTRYYLVRFPDSLAF